MKSYPFCSGEFRWVTESQTIGYRTTGITLQGSFRRVYEN